jgi:hypothetical protein
MMGKGGGVAYRIFLYTCVRIGGGSQKIVQLRTKGRGGVKYSGNFAYVLNGCPLGWSLTSSITDLIVVYGPLYKMEPYCERKHKYITIFPVKKTTI